MPHGQMLLARDLRLLVCNTRCLELMGLSAEQMRPGVTLREIVAMRVAAGRHPGCTVDEVYARRAAILAKGEPATLKTSYDDQTTMQVAYRPMNDGGWVLTYEDVTERELHLDTLRRQEEELRTQNLRFDAALNNMAQGLMMLDRECRLIVCNDRYLDLMGLSPEVAKPGATLREIIEHGAALGHHPTLTAQEVLDARMALFARGEPAVLHTPFKDGRTIQTTYNPMADGGWVVTYEDVTERELHLRTLQRQEEEMRTQNLRFDTALNNMSHGLCMFDGERRLIVCNRRYAEMYGLPPELTQPGVTYDEVLQHRLRSGMYPRGRSGELRRGADRGARRGPADHCDVELQDGRILSIAYQPMPAGGWVASTRT
jgi:PAS domain-containing protein